MSSHEAEMTDRIGEAVFGRHERGFILWPLVTENEVKARIRAALASQSSQLSALSDELEKVKAYMDAACEARDEAGIFPATPAEAIRMLKADCDTAEAALSSLRARVREIDACFEAAYAEGLQERLNDEADRSVGTIYDLIVRRLLFAHIAARQLVEDMGE